MADILLGKLRTVRTNFAMILMAGCLIRRVDRGEMEKVVGRVIVGEDGFYCVGHDAELPDTVGDFYEINLSGAETGRDHMALEASKMALRNLTQDTYEAVFDYCEQTRQLPHMQDQSWYQFARVMRNSVTHTQHFKFRESVIKVLPISWRGKTIELGMDGREVSFSFYDWHDGLELFDEIYQFCEGLT